MVYFSESSQQIKTVRIDQVGNKLTLKIITLISTHIFLLHTLVKSALLFTDIMEVNTTIYKVSLFLSFLKHCNLLGSKLLMFHPENYWIFQHKSRKAVTTFLKLGTHCFLLHLRSWERWFKSCTTGSENQAQHLTCTEFSQVTHSTCSQLYNK